MVSFAKMLARLGLVFALPLLIHHWATVVLEDEADRIGGLRFEALCTLAESSEGPVSRVDCSATALLGTLVAGSEIAILLAAAPILAFFAIALFCGANRWLNALVFPRLIPVAIGCVVVNLLVQGALLLLAVMLGYLVHAANPPVKMLVFASGGVLAAAGSVIAGAVSLELDRPFRTRAMALPRRRASKLWALVDRVAEELGAEPPDNLVLGFDIAIWAMDHDVLLEGQGISGRLRGRTLHLSMPLMRVLTSDEFRALVAHELGHFRGRDTVYTTRFVPVHAALSGARAELEADGSLAPHPVAQVIGTVARAPAVALLHILSVTFERNVARIGRRREVAADAAAAEVAPERAVATALLKMPLYARLWDEMLADHAWRAETERPTSSTLGRHFGDLVRLLVTDALAAALRDRGLAERTAHPFDRHPTGGRRVRALGLDPRGIEPAELRAAPRHGVLDDLLPHDVREEAEFALTLAENEALHLARRVRQRPATGPWRTDPLYEAVYALLAPLVTAAPDPAECFTAAVRTGNAEMTEFDRLRFADHCRGRVPDAAKPGQAALALAAAAGPEALSVLAEIAAALPTDPAALGPVLEALGRAAERTGSTA